MATIATSFKVWNILKHRRWTIINRKNIEFKEENVWNQISYFNGLFALNFISPLKLPFEWQTHAWLTVWNRNFYLREILLSIHESEVTCARAMKFRFSSPFCVSEIKLHAKIQKLRFNEVYVNDMNKSKMNFFGDERGVTKTIKCPLPFHIQTAFCWNLTFTTFEVIWMDKSLKSRGH